MASILELLVGKCFWTGKLSFSADARAKIRFSRSEWSEKGAVAHKIAQRIFIKANIYLPHSSGSERLTQHKRNFTDTFWYFIAINKMGRAPL